MNVPERAKKPVCLVATREIKISHHTICKNSEIIIDREMPAKEGSLVFANNHIEEWHGQPHSGVVSSVWQLTR